MSTKTLGCAPDPIVTRRRACIGDLLAQGMMPKDMIEPVCQQFGEISLGTLYNDVKWLRAHGQAGQARSWTDEMDRRCLALKAAGKSLSAIGSELGVSRSAVSGRLYRLEQAAAKPAPKPEAKASPTNRRRRPRSGPPDASRPGPADASRPRRQEAPETPPIACVPVTDTADNRLTGAPAAVMALTARSCRWPIGDPCDADFRFCGATALDGSSWCAEHAAIAWPAGGAS